jgi:hypothetical protein
MFNTCSYELAIDHAKSRANAVVMVAQCRSAAKNPENVAEIKSHAHCHTFANCA